METVFIIIGVVIAGIWLLGTVSIKRHAEEYKNALRHAMNAMDESSYKSSDIYKKRMDVLKNQGWVEASYNLSQDLRSFMLTDNKVSPSFFKREDILNMEHLFLMKYALVHGQSDEFQRSMVLGKKIEKMMEG